MDTCQGAGSMPSATKPQALSLLSSSDTGLVFLTTLVSPPSLLNDLPAGMGVGRKNMDISGFLRWRPAASWELEGDTMERENEPPGPGGAGLGKSGGEGSLPQTVT